MFLPKIQFRNGLNFLLAIFTRLNKARQALENCLLEDYLNPFFFETKFINKIKNYFKYSEF